MKNSKYLEILAARVAAGSSIRLAAADVGCSESTAYALSSSAEFKTAVSTIRTQAVEQAVGVLSAASTKAAQSLVKLLDSADEKIVLAAADKLLSKLGPLQELHELRLRIDAIESQGPKLMVVR